MIVDKKDKQEVEAKDDEKGKKAEVVFELGNPAQHLVFSKPVKVEVPVLTKENQVTVGVKHVGQSEYSTDAIVDESGNAKSTFDVIDGKVIFYTLGASSFTLTPTTGTIAFTNPSNGATINQGQPITGTGTNGATVNLTLNGVGTNVGSSIVASGVWSITPSPALPLGSNTVCIGSTCRTFTVTAPSTTSPGGVSSNLGIWVKSDQGLNCTTNACDVTTWTTANGVGTLNEIGTASASTFKSATSGTNFNYQPAVNFAQTLSGMQLAGTNMGAADRTVCAVHTIPSTSAIVRTVAQFGYADDPFMGYYGDKQMLWDSYTYAAVDQVANTITPNKPTLSCYSWKPGGKMDMGLNGKFLTGVANTHATTGTDFNLGYDSNAGGYSDSTTAEAVVYKSLRTNADFAKVESYLASKYGITLDQSVAKDYIASNGSKIFDAAVATPAYNNNITVIGRDDVSTLNTKQSVTVNDVPEPLKISRGPLAVDNASNASTFAANQSYLAVSDNNQTGVALVDTATTCAAPGTSTTGRTNRTFFFQPTNYSESTRVSADWLTSYYSAAGPMYMLVADDASFTTNKVQVPMLQSGASWYADYAFPSDKYVAFIGSTTIPNLMTGDKEINWLKKPWKGGSYLPASLGWGPGTMTDTQGDTTYTMKVTDPGNTSYAKSIWSGYPSYYPLSYGDTLQWVGLDTGTPDTVTFEISGTKAAKSASFMIHGIDKYYYNDTLKVEGFIGGSAVSPKLTDYSGFADSVSVSGNTATGTDYWGWRWGPYGDVKVNFNAPVDKILVTYKPSSTYSSLWWQEFSIGNIKFKGAQPAPTYVPADGVYLYKEVSPETVELGEEKTVDFTFQNINCTDKTINFNDILPNGTYVKETLIGAPAGTVNTYSDTNTLTIANAVIPSGTTNMSVKIKATAIGNYLNQATFNVGANNYTSDLESTATANDKSPYNVIASTKQIANLNITKSANVTTSLQNGVVEYTYTIVNAGTAAVPTVDIEDTLSGTQKYIPGTLVNPLSGATVIGNNGATPPAETYGNGNILSIKGATIPVGTTVIKVNVNVNSAPVGNVLKNKVGFTVLDPTYQALYKDSNETSVTIVAITPLNLTINQASTQADPQTIGATNTNVKFTATFDQDIDETTLANSDFTVGGTATGCTVTGFVANPTGQKKIYDATVDCGNNTANNTKTVTLSMTATKVKSLTGNDNTPSTSTDNTVTLNSPATTPTIIIGANVLDYNAGGVNTGTVGDSYCKDFGDITGAPGCLTTVSLSGQNKAYNEYRVVISTNPAPTTAVTNTAYAFSTDNVCDATDTWVTTTFNSTSIDSNFNVMVTDESHNGQYVCARMNFGGTTVYQSSSWVIKVDRTDPLVTITDNGNTTQASSDLIKIAVTDAGGNVPTESYYRLVSTPAACTDITKPYYASEYAPFPGSGYTSFLIADGITFTNPADNGKFVCIQTRDTTNKYEAQYGSFGYNTNFNFTKVVTTALNIVTTPTDTTAPSAPTVNPVKNTDTTVTGKAEPGSTVKLVDATGTPIVCTPDPVVAANGTWSCIPATTPANGTIIKATQKDPAGNTSGPATTTVDQTPPTAPVCTAQADKTVICTPVTPGDTVTIPGTTCTPSPATTTGTVTCTNTNPTAPAPTGPATTTDPAGNTTPSPVVPYTPTDTTAPSAPVITGPVSGTTTTNDKPTFKGTGEVGAIVKVYDEFNNLVCQTTVDSSGNWTCTPAFGQGEGEHKYTAIQTNLAGNVSPRSNPPITLILDINTDGATTAEENAAPNNGDNNGDGILDSKQQNVTSKSNPNMAGKYATLMVDASSQCPDIRDYYFKSEPQLAIADPSYDYPIGLFGFKLKCATPGASANVTIILDKQYDTSKWIYRKYNNITKQYFDASQYITYGTMRIGGNTVTTIKFVAKDGGPLDEDGIANGEFVDPNGPALVTSVTPDPSDKPVQTMTNLLRTGGASSQSIGEIVSIILLGVFMIARSTRRHKK